MKRGHSETEQSSEEKNDKEMLFETESESTVLCEAELLLLDSAEKNRWPGKLCPLSVLLHSESPRMRSLCDSCGSEPLPLATAAHLLGQVNVAEDMVDILQHRLYGRKEFSLGDVLAVLEKEENKLGVLRTMHGLRDNPECYQNQRFLDLFFKTVTEAMTDSSLMVDVAKLLCGVFENRAHRPLPVAERCGKIFLSLLKKTMLDDVCHPQAPDILYLSFWISDSEPFLEELAEMLMAIAAKKKLPCLVRTFVLSKIDGCRFALESKHEKEAKISEMVERVAVLLLNLDNQTRLDTEETIPATAPLDTFITSQFTNLYANISEDTEPPWIGNFPKMAEKLSDGNRFP